MKLFKRFRMWFWTKKKTIDFLTEFNEVLNSKTDEALKKIEELDQSKVYYIVLEDCSHDDFLNANEFLKKIGTKLKWTIPKIIIFNRELKELTKKQVEDLLKNFKEEKNNARKN